MTPAMRDVLEQLGCSESKVFGLGDLETVFDMLLVQGLKIGGTYLHWKGKEYIVRSVSRDADDWDTFLVTYVEVEDARHEATRKVTWFLGDMDDHRHTGPRFRLVS